MHSQAFELVGLQHDHHKQAGSQTKLQLERSAHLLILKGIVRIVALGVDCGKLMHYHNAEASAAVITGTTDWLEGFEGAHQGVLAKSQLWAIRRNCQNLQD